jgi:hypothetical protein
MRAKERRNARQNRDSVFENKNEDPSRVSRGSLRLVEMHAEQLMRDMKAQIFH